MLGTLFIIGVVAAIIISYNAKTRKSRNQVRRPSINTAYMGEHRTESWYSNRPSTGPARISQVKVDPHMRSPKMGTTSDYGSSTDFHAVVGIELLLNSSISDCPLCPNIFKSVLVIGQPHPVSTTLNKSLLLLYASS